MHLKNTRITDDSAKTIRRFDHLQFLKGCQKTVSASWEGRKITYSRLVVWQPINIQDDKFADATVSELQKVMPQVKIGFFYEGKRGR